MNINAYKKSNIYKYNSTVDMNSKIQHDFEKTYSSVDTQGIFFCREYMGKICISTNIRVNNQLLFNQQI